MSHSGTLTGTGWVEWTDIAALLDGDPCLWTDLGGLHRLEPAPAALPVGATHLWSWRRDRWVRVRLESGRVLATILIPGATEGGTPVTYTTPDGIAWKRHERAAECLLTLQLAQTQGPAPLTFITCCHEIG